MIILTGLKFQALSFPTWMTAKFMCLSFVTVHQLTVCNISVTFSDQVEIRLYHNLEL
jgi:hypothetical protein